MWAGGHPWSHKAPPGYMGNPPPKKKLIPPIRFTMFVLPEQCASQGVSHHPALACRDGINPKAAVGDTALDVVLFLNPNDKH